MDSKTHTILAARLLQIAGYDGTATGCSLLPQIDRQPAYLHRLYAHTVFKGHDLLRAYRRHLNGHGQTDTGYVSMRIAAEAGRIEAHAQVALHYTGSTAAPDLHWDETAAMLAFVSHLYSDVFNNPIQAFAPLFVYPSGAWSLWSNLKNLEFRHILYEASTLNELHSKVFAEEYWQDNYPPEALISALVRRIAAHGAVVVPPAVLEEALNSVVASVPSESKIEAAEEFLIDHERLLVSEITRLCETPRG